MKLKQKPKNKKYLILVPFLVLPLTLFKPITAAPAVYYDIIARTTFHAVKVDKKQLGCLAEDLFYEGHGTDFYEMVKLSNIIENRLKLSEYPDTVCEVVHQHIQFSWHNSRKNNINKINRLIKKNAKEAIAWENAKRIAMLSISNQLPDVTKGSISYHSVKIAKPNSSFWKKMKYSLTSPYHIYYTKDIGVN